MPSSEHRPYRNLHPSPVGLCRQLSPPSPHRYVAVGGHVALVGPLPVRVEHHVGAVDHMKCPLLGHGCEAVADAPFARPFGIPDGFIGAPCWGAWQIY